MNLEEKQQRGKEGFDLNDKIRRNEILRRALLAQNAFYLSEILDKKLYKEILGDDESEWAAYLGQVEVFYTRNDVYNLIRIFKKFQEELGLNMAEIIDVPRTRLVDLLKIATKENVDEWLHKARLLCSADWTIEIRKAKGLVVEDECKHNYQQFEMCKICGQKHKL